MSIGRSSHVKPSIFRSVGHRHLKRCSSDRQTHQVAIPEAGQANLKERQGLVVSEKGCGSHGHVTSHDTSNPMQSVVTVQSPVTVHGRNSRQLNLFSSDFAEDSALSPGEHSEKAATQSCSPDRIHGNVPLVGMIGIDWPLKKTKIACERSCIISGYGPASYACLG